MYIETYGTHKIPVHEILEIVNNNFDFSVNNIITELDLLRPIYADTANFGHFGRADIKFPWENVKDLK